jgi:hypothetical protein
MKDKKRKKTKGYSEKELTEDEVYQRKAPKKKTN